MQQATLSSNVTAGAATLDLLSITPATVLEGGDLDPGSGLLLLLRDALNRLDEGVFLELRTRSGHADDDLAAWCRRRGHELRSVFDAGDHVRYLVRKGHAAAGTRVPADRAKPVAASTHESPDWGVRLPPWPDGSLDLRDWLLGRTGTVPEEAP